jgi:hypothetical protein
MGLSPSAFEKQRASNVYINLFIVAKSKVLFCLVPPALCVVVTLSKAEAPKDYN